jgi:outer membrane lipase/esterase
MFADSIHPTTATHALFAAFAESLIDGPAAYSMLAETPIHTRANHIRTLVDGLQQNEAKPVGGWDVFVAADGGTFDADMAAGKAGSHNKALTIGATARVSDAAMMGIAVGKNRADGSFGGDLGGYGTDELVFSVIGGARWGGLYGNAALSISNLDFRGVHRNIALGPVTRVATADPTGSNASAFFELGYDFQTHGFSIGPTVSVTAQDVSVSSFSESADAGSAALKIDSQRRKSEVWSAGVRASYAMGNWTPWLRVTADKERKDDPRFVTATPLSLIATGNSYDIPAYLADSNYVTTWVGIHGHLDEQIGLSLSYYYVSGRSGVKEDGLSALVSYRF